MFGYPSACKQALVAIALPLYSLSGTAWSLNVPVPAGLEPPFGFRVTSLNSSVLESAILADRNGFSFYVDPKATLDQAYAVYPSDNFFNCSRSPIDRNALYKDKYHSLTNSSEFILFWTGRPPKAVSQPVARLSSDYGPGISHTWPGSTFVSWGGWQFYLNQADGKVTFDKNGFAPKEWRWVAWYSHDGLYTLGKWDGTIPPKEEEWGSQIYDEIARAIEVEIEVVSLANSTAMNTIGEVQSHRIVASELSRICA